MEKIVLPKELRMSIKSMSFRDRTPFHQSMIVVAYREHGKQKWVQPIDARFYMSKAGNVSCAVWVRTYQNYGLGIAKADGYGYHKASAALHHALLDMGFEIPEELSCYCKGETAMQNTLLEIAKALGYDNCHVVWAHR